MADMPMDMADMASQKSVHQGFIFICLHISLNLKNILKMKLSIWKTATEIS